MDAVIQHASIASMSLVGSSVLTALALTNPLGLAALAMVVITWMTHHYDRRGKK